MGQSLVILVAADNVLARVGLAALLADQPQIAHIIQTPLDGNWDEALQRQPDVIIVDVGWNMGRAAMALEPLNDFHIPILLLVATEDALADMPDILTDRVYGLLLRDSDPELITVALQALARGLVVVEPLLASSLYSRAAPPAEGSGESLTPRESEVLQLLAQGMTNKAIAHRLNITEHTVKFHVNAIMGKLNAQSRTDAVVRATRLGWVIL